MGPKWEILQFRSLKKREKHWLNKVLRMPNSTIEKPYKTCRKWRLLGPFCEKGPGNDQKSITIIVFSQRVFKTSRNSVTPPEFADFQNAKTRCENPYKTCRIWILLEPKVGNGLKIIKKHYLEKVSATRFQNVQKLSNTTGIRRFSKCKNALRKTL